MSADRFLCPVFALFVGWMLVFPALSFAEKPAPTPTVQIVAPAAGSVVVPGAEVPVRIETRHFVLRKPVAHHHGAKQAEHAAAAHGQTQEGHYHIYLNDAAGDDPHVTAWTTASSYVLPPDLATGVHRLRVELRDNFHVPLGIATSVTVTVAP